MGLIPSVLPPGVNAALSGVPQLQEDIGAIRALLERLVELEERKIHDVVVDNTMALF